MKNKLTDLNTYLFAQIERLSDEDIKGDKLKEEILRSHAVAGVARNIINNANLALKAERLMSEGIINRPPEMMEQSKPLRLVKE